MTRYTHSLLLLPLLAIATPALADGPTSTITQHGLTNIATIDQSDGAGVTAEIFQSGENLAATITQFWEPTGYYPNVANTAAVNQSGGLNSATIDQAFSEDGDANDAYIGQGWSTNVATIEQGAGLNTARINQNSVSNLATVSQKLSVPGGINLIVIDQAGAGSNTATATQYLHAGTIHIVQDSSFSTADVAQSAADHDAQIRQYGALQSAEILQLAGDDFGDGAISTISQSGIGNSAVTTQTATSYSSAIVQDGNANEATVTQHLEEGTSLIQQFGSNNSASVSFENAIFSDASIRQEGEGHLATFVNNSSFADAFISQYGTGHIATVTQ
jgi:hypothetical protein